MLTTHSGPVQASNATLPLSLSQALEARLEIPSAWQVAYVLAAAKLAPPRAPRWREIPPSSPYLKQSCVIRVPLRHVNCIGGCIGYWQGCSQACLRSSMSICCLGAGIWAQERGKKGRHPESYSHADLFCSYQREWENTSERALPAWRVCPFSTAGVLPQSPRPEKIFHMLPLGLWTWTKRGGATMQVGASLCKSSHHHPVQHQWAPPSLSHATTMQCWVCRGRRLQAQE
jgi:hypothetical protein